MEAIVRTSCDGILVATRYEQSSELFKITMQLLAHHLSL